MSWAERLKKLIGRDASRSANWDAATREEIRKIHLATWLPVADITVFGGNWPKGLVATAEAARKYRWKEVLRSLRTVEGGSPNEWALDPDGWNAVLHRAAEGGASLDVVEQILSCGAWRMLPNKAGELPRDIAIRKGHAHLFDILDPPVRHIVPPDELDVLEKGFHFHVLGPDPGEYASELSEEDFIGIRRHYLRLKTLRLPPLSILTELENPRMSFEIPYGSHRYWLQNGAEGCALICELRDRATEPSLVRFEITQQGRRRVPLIEAGFPLSSCPSTLTNY